MLYIDPWTVNQKCTCVKKQKKKKQEKKRKQVGIMKEYRQVLAAVESVGDRKATVRISFQPENTPGVSS